MMSSLMWMTSVQGKIGKPQLHGRLMKPIIYNCSGRKIPLVVNGAVMSGSIRSIIAVKITNAVSLSCPVWWADPMPKPPESLGHLNFRRMDFTKLMQADDE